MIFGVGGSARAALVLALCLGPMDVTRADTEVPAAEPATTAGAPRDWEVSVAPYLWGAGLVGDLTARGVDIDVDASFSDILDQLNVGAMLFAQGRWRRFVWLLDALYMKLEDDVEAQLISFPLGPTLNAQVKVEMEQALVDLKVGYRVLDREAPGAASGEDRRLVVDLLAGGRWWYMKADVDLRVFVLGPGIFRSAEKSTDWVDPLVGARLRVDLTPKLDLAVLGDVGGFGVGSASDFTWQTTAVLGWQVGERWRLHAGYKLLDLDRSKGSGASKLEADVQMRGPVMGASYTF